MASLQAQGPGGIIILTVQVTLLPLEGLTHQGLWEQEDIGGAEGHGQKGLLY